MWNELIEMQTDLIWPIEVHNGTLFSFHNISSVYKWTQLNCLSCITKSVIFTDCRWQDIHFFFQTILLCSLISRAAVPQSWNWNCNDQGWHYLWSWGWIDIVKLSVLKKLLLSLLLLLGNEDSRKRVQHILTLLCICCWSKVSVLSVLACFPIQSTPVYLKMVTENLPLCGLVFFYLLGDLLWCTYLVQASSPHGQILVLLWQNDTWKILVRVSGHWIDWIEFLFG